MSSWYKHYYLLPIYKFRLLDRWAELYCVLRNFNIESSCGTRLKKSLSWKDFFQIRCNLGLQCQNYKPKIKLTNYFGLQTHLLKITDNSTFVAREWIQGRILFIHMLFLFYVLWRRHVCWGLFCLVSFTKW